MKPIECAECGSVFERTHPAQKRCDPCRTPAPVRTKECRGCSVTITLDTPARLYCDTCRPSGGPAKDVVSCPVCSTPFILSGGRGRPRKYCSRNCSAWASANPRALSGYQRMVKESKRDPNALERFMGRKGLPIPTTRKP